MKKSITNFGMDILLFAVLASQAFTGALLHRFPPELADTAVLGLARYTWGTIHWVVSLMFVIVIITHLVLHWGWMKATTQRYFKMSSKALMAFLIVLSILFLFTPFYLTRDFPDREEVRDTYTEKVSFNIISQEAGFLSTCESAIM